MRETAPGSGRRASVVQRRARLRRPLGFAGAMAGCSLVVVGLGPLACGSTAPLVAGDAGGGGDAGSGGGSGSGGGGGQGAGGPDGGLGGNVQDSAASGPPHTQPGPGEDGGVACPPGLQCNVACTGGGATTTTVTGKVYDPALKNPLYNVAVYVPAVPLVPLPPGVPTGADACSCGALFRSGAITNTSTAEDGSFTLENVPVGAKVPLVLQIGKWRRQVLIDVAACQANAQPDKSLAFLGTVPAGDTDDSIPDIAVSTGSADTLECLMLRIGIPASEYVAGAGTSGHIHIFAGGSANGGGGVGSPEANAMPGAPASPTSLWASQAQLMPYDIVLLSCEGGETYEANPAALESYLNAGGRAFGSHFHYSWFSGPIASAGASTYVAPPDWGPNLATWTADQGNNKGPIGGQLDTTLNGSSNPFSKGVSLQKWLTNVNALGQNGVPAGELSIYSPRFNATVAPANTPSQPWISADSTSSNPGATMYFSFDTPVKPAPLADGGAGPYCGRAVFSDLHVSGDPSEKDTGNAKKGSPPPAGCDSTDLSPQEKALEFMLFDLSSCVIPDTVGVPTDAGLPPPPPVPK